MYTPHLCVDLGSGEKSGPFLPSLGHAEGGMEDVFHGIGLVIAEVMLLNGSLFLFRKPITLPFKQFLFELGVYLVHVDVTDIDVILNLYADEAAAACMVAQKVAAVAGADEGGDALQRFGASLLGLADIGVLHLHQVLQQRRFLGGEFVELIDVDQAESGKLCFTR